MKRPVALLAILFLTALPEAARSEAPAPVTGIAMYIGGLTTNDGTVYCDLYDKEEGFPSEPKLAVARVKARPQNKQATCVFADVKAGRYAVAIWHDVDDDRELDSNLFGVPSEPVGSSNNAEGSFGPPSFKDAAFDYQPPMLKQTIRLE
jgi:uncharacterized protein (DUF2141 family)